MKKNSFLILFTLLACDSHRLFETNTDFVESQWLTQQKPTFEFRIRDLGKRYNVLCNVRNTSDYPYARLFVNFSLKDSTGAIVTKELKSIFLFDAKTGKPLGTSGIGDLYDQRLPLLADFPFPYTGRFTVELEQQMRLDTLSGISAVGLRVEEAAKPE
jgi:gliding motility-associated lipoprotein GldH